MFFLCVSKVNGNASENRFFFCIFFLCTVNIQSINKRKNTYNLAHMVFRSNRKTFFFFFYHIWKRSAGFGSPHKEHELWTLNPWINKKTKTNQKQKGKLNNTLSKTSLFSFHVFCFFFKFHWSICFSHGTRKQKHRPQVHKRAASRSEQNTNQRLTGHNHSLTPVWQSHSSPSHPLAPPAQSGSVCHIPQSPAASVSAATWEKMDCKLET